MDKKEVRIIGLSINKQFGILQACKLEFNQDNRLITVRGAVGEGKTTLQKSLQLGTQGSKTLIDKNLYGEIDTETQLLDGEKPIWVGCRSNKEGKLIYTIYTKDGDGNIIKEPIIDGVKATPAKYLDMLQTELTWKMDELTSENPTVQRKILLKLYQHKLKEIGVIFDKKAPSYKDTILHKIEVAEDKRSMLDALRKQYGGIAEDLKARGFDVNRPATLPERVDLDDINKKIKKLEDEIIIEETNIESKKENELQKIKTQAAEETSKAIQYNSKLKEQYEQLYAFQEKSINKWKEQQLVREENIYHAEDSRNRLRSLGFVHADLNIFIENMPQPQTDNERPKNEVQEPTYIQINENNQVTVTEETKNIDIVKNIIKLKYEYGEVNEKDFTVDTSKQEKNIDILKTRQENAQETNKVCDAVDSFFDWQAANEEVLFLKNKYIQLLSKVDTGVKGLKIVPEEAESGNAELYLKYNGEYDTAYFSNKNKEYRKLSSYSGTQKPVICLLIQNYLLNQKPKSMRYMYIDNIPMDNKTVKLLKDMCNNLNLRIFLNITGDFEQTELTAGEFLIEGGEVFFNKN